MQNQLQSTRRDTRLFPCQRHWLKECYIQPLSINASLMQARSQDDRKENFADALWDPSAMLKAKEVAPTVSSFVSY